MRPAECRSISFMAGPRSLPDHSVRQFVPANAGHRTTWDLSAGVSRGDRSWTSRACRRDFANSPPSAIGSPFHTPKNLAMALLVEAAELAEIFQWLTPEQSQVAKADAVLRERVAHEGADVLLYLAQLADHMER